MLQQHSVNIQHIFFLCVYVYEIKQHKQNESVIFLCWYVTLIPDILGKVPVTATHEKYTIVYKKKIIRYLSKRVSITLP